jgi:hypothetical protein
MGYRPLQDSDLLPGALNAPHVYGSFTRLKIRAPVDAYFLLSDNEDPLCPLSYLRFLL